MSSFKVKLQGEAPETAYLRGTPRPKKKTKQVVDSSRWEEYLRRMIVDMRNKETERQKVWAELTRKRVAKARDEGYSEGFSAGRDEGYEEGKNSIDEVTEKLSAMVEILTTERESIISSATRLVVELANEIAVKIVHTELETKPEIILEIVESALNKLMDKERVIIRVHPTDLEAVRQNEKTWRTVTESIKQLVIEEDPLLEPGDVIIETNSGVIDARVESQIAQMRRVIAEVMKNES